MQGHMRTLAGLAIVVAIGISGCGRVPEEELADAKHALDSARTLEAEHYCEETYAQAQDLLDSAAAEILRQRRRPQFVRLYGKARRLLEQAGSVAREAQESVPEAREAYQRETEKVIKRAEDVIEVTAQLVKEAKSGGKQTQGIQAELADMRKMLSVADAVMESGDLVRARAMATSIIDRAGAYRTLLPQLPSPDAKFAAGVTHTPQ